MRLRPHLSWPLVAVLLAAALHMLLFDRGLGGDGWAGFATLGSLADDGDAWVEDDDRGVMNGLVGTPEGHLAMQYPPGVLALDALPFAAGRLADRILPGSWMADGFELPPAGRVPRGVFLSAAMIVLARNAVTLLGLFWTFRALRRMEFPEGIAAAATALIFFGGPLVFYSLVGMTHAPVFALAGLLLLVLVKQRESGSFKLALAAGAVVGAAVLLRYGSITLAAPAALAISRRRWPAFVGGLLPFLAILPVWWRGLFGAWSPPYGGTWTITAVSPWNVLFSPVHGLFLFHPALLLAAVGLAMALRRSPGWGTVSIVWFLAVAVLYGWWSEWNNAGGYGQRFLTDALPALGIGFAAFLQGRGASAAERQGQRHQRHQGQKSESHPEGGVLVPAVPGVPDVPVPALPPRGLLGAALVLALLGYALFFAAVGGLAPPPPGLPWPQRLGDYTPLLHDPPGPRELADALRRASLPVRAVAGPAR